MSSGNRWNKLVLSLVIPMYNEEENVAAVLQGVHDALAGRLIYELVVVNDGSTDNTQDILCRLQTIYPDLKIVRHLENKGQSAAIVNGVKHSFAPWVATLDGDGQNDPRDILRLFSYASGYDPHRDTVLITGIRINRQDNWLRRASSRMANIARQILFRDGCPDAGSGLKIFPRRAFLELPHFDHMHRFLPVLFKRANGKLINVPVNHRSRLLGKSKYGVWNRLWISIVDLLGVKWLQKRDINVEVEVLSPINSKMKGRIIRKVPKLVDVKDVLLHDQ